MTKTFWH